MLSYKEHDNAQAVEILLKGRVSTEEFDSVASKLEAFIQRHGQVRVLEIIKDFEGMDAVAFWHDIKFSLRHLKDFSRMAVVCNSRHASSLVQSGCPFHVLRGGAFRARPGRGSARLADVARGSCRLI